MEPGVVAALYSAETAIEGAVGAALAIARPTMPLKAKFRRISTGNQLPRSSHSLSVIKGRAYIFGGEIRPREPVDNVMHIYTLPSSGVSEADYKPVTACFKDADGEVPAPRVGHTAATIDNRIYVFGGRGGPDMKPLEENGRVWSFDTFTSTWSHLDPVKGTPFPAPRSYHAATANEHPLPTKEDHTINPVGSPDLEEHGTVFIHAGCPASGRLADIWAFDVAARTWSKYPDAPGPPRGGPSLTIAQNRLYRFGGFDGTNELGGQIDYLELGVNTFNDKGGRGELSVFPKIGNWESVSFAADGKSPGNRSVAGLQPITTGQGREYLLLILGERDPSSKGHEGAGKFWGDVWSYQLGSEKKTAASIKDAARHLIGAHNSEGTWAEVEILEATKDDSERGHPGERGWFASAQGQDLDAEGVIIFGGINGKNERLGDGWFLTLDT